MNRNHRSMILALAAVVIASLPVRRCAAQTAEAETNAAIARIKSLDSKIRAVIALDPTALDQARSTDQRRRVHGLLYGYVILLKDNIEADGPLPTTAGSLALLENVTHRDAPLVKRLRTADAVILGKTNLSEWANIRSNASISGWSAVGGQTRNPYALDRDPCGSSSGSAAAVSAGEVEAAIGTETDGSITCPAAVNGVHGEFIGSRGAGSVVQTSTMSLPAIRLEV
jgi:amidase